MSGDIKKLDMKSTDIKPKSKKEKKDIYAGRAKLLKEELERFDSTQAKIDYLKRKIKDLKKNIKRKAGGVKPRVVLTHEHLNSLLTIHETALKAQQKLLREEGNANVETTAELKEGLSEIAALKAELQSLRAELKKE
jgi:hypothetical protein